jgi:hypothetical protein
MPKPGICKMLIEAGINVNLIDNFGDNVVGYLTKLKLSQRPQDVLRTLIEGGLNFELVRKEELK